MRGKCKETLKRGVANSVCMTIDTGDANENREGGIRQRGSCVARDRGGMEGETEAERVSKGKRWTSLKIFP